jgi:hypothetical protein
MNLFFNCLLTCSREVRAYTSALNSNSAPQQPRRVDSGPVSPAFFSVLLGIMRRPQQILFLWNWKSALLSVILRGPIFLAVSLRHGVESALAALFTELVFCMLSAGFYGAIVQEVRNAEPQWLTGVFITVVIPAVFQVLEYLLHWLRGTPHLRLAEIISLAVSAISGLFNWYAMRRGTLLVGGEGGSFGADLRSLPRLILNFIAVLPRRLFLRSHAGVGFVFLILFGDRGR